MTVELEATQPAPAPPTPPGVGRRPSPPLPEVTATAPGTAAAIAGTTDAPAPIGPGSRLAHFEIVRPLGHGGMGEVYLATDLALDRPVALKLLPVALARDDARRARLVREARAQARLNHTNVGHLYFIGEDLGHLFFAMEYIEGETLAQRLERGPIAPDEALELVRMAALGLREAHRHGFTHRDIKPSNLMIDSHGVLKVMDFGLVTATLSEESAAAAEESGTHVAATALVGTPLYMAPEQGQGRAVDHRADIYALGATLHHMIAGAPPFAGDSAAALLSQHESASRTSLIQGVKRAGRRALGSIEATVARMMAKRPVDRPASYDALIGELERCNPERSRPAGFWPRSVAAGLDLMLSIGVAMPVAILAGGEGGLGLLLYGLVVVPLVMARFGTTAGHSLLDLEVVREHDGGRPRLGAAFVRAFVMLGPFSFGLALEATGNYAGPEPLDEIGTVIGILGAGWPLFELARAVWSTREARTLWDRAAATRVRYRVPTSSAARTVLSSK